MVFDVASASMVSKYLWGSTELNFWINYNLTNCLNHGNPETLKTRHQNCQFFIRILDAYNTGEITQGIVFAPAL